METKVLIGVDPHKATNTVAVLDEDAQLLERAEFSADRQGLRALERWAKRFPERRWAVEGANGLGRTLAHKLASAGEEVVDVPPKLSARVGVLSVGNWRKNDGLDATFAALAAWRNGHLAQVCPDDRIDVLRLLSDRREDLVSERTRVLNRLHGLLRDLIPGGVSGRLSANRASRILRSVRPPSRSVGNWLPSSCATCALSTGGSQTSTLVSAKRWRPRAPPSPTSSVWVRSWLQRSSPWSGTPDGSRPKPTSPPTPGSPLWRSPAGRWCA